MLYKYRDFSDANKLFFQSLLENKIWFPRASSFEDQFDCCPNLVLPDDPVAKRAILIEMMRASGLSDEELHQVFDDGGQEFENKAVELARASLRARTLVLSLSQEAASLEMWTRYAGNFEGVCLGFGDNDNSSRFANAHRVIYLSERINFPIKLHYSDSEKIKYFTNKTLEYEFEKEARFIDFVRYHPESEGAQGIYCEFEKNQLKKVIFGQNCARDKRAYIWSALAEKGFSVDYAEAIRDGDAVQICSIET